MASGGGEHRMLFDIRGRRKTAVKVVYAVLAVLMGLSLFLVVGPLNIGEIFSNESSSGEATKQFEEQEQRIEVKLRKDPENPDLLLALTRAQVNTGNSQVVVQPNGAQEMTVEALQSYQQVSQTWSEYLQATKQPSSGLALLVAPVLLKLAEFSRSLQEAERNVTAAAQAQKIVAEQRPSLNSYSTLAIYTYFSGDFAAAKQAEKKAMSYAPTKPEKEAVEKQTEAVKKNAVEFQHNLKKAEKEGKAAAKENGGKAPPLEGNTLGGATLGE